MDEDKINLGNTFDRTGTGMKLMSNPFENTKTKIKKKKKWYVEKVERLEKNPKEWNSEFNIYSNFFNHFFFS